MRDIKALRSLRVENALEDRGVFWWFGETHGHTASLETSIPGKLTISDEGHIELQLEGELWLEKPEASLHWDESRWLPTEKIVAGRLNDQNVYILLFNLVRTDFSFVDDKPVRQSYEANLCLANGLPFPEHFSLDSFHALRIELKGLKEWLQLDSIQVDYPFRDGDITEFKISYKHHEFEYNTPKARIAIENDILGVPYFRLSDHPLAKINIRQTNWLIYTPSKESTLNELRSAFVQIEELLVLLLGRYFRLDWPNLVSGSDIDERWYKVYSSRAAQGEKLSPWIYLWTTFPALRDKFGDLLNAWQINLEKYEVSYELYIASLKKPLQHPEHEFVNLVWAIESLHRNWQRETAESASMSEGKAKVEEILKRFTEPSDKKIKKWLERKLKYAYEPALEQRIVDVFDRLPFTINPAQLKSFASRVQKRRNDISHEGGPRPGEDAESFRGEIHALAEALRYLFHALLLHEIGIAPDILLKTLTQSGLAERNVLPALRRVSIDLPISDHTGPSVGNTEEV
jgi:hypothetical protein